MQPWQCGRSGPSDAEPVRELLSRLPAWLQLCLVGDLGERKEGRGGTQCVAGWVDEHCENVKLVQLFCRFKTEYEFETYKELTSRSEGLFCSR